MRDRSVTGVVAAAADSDFDANGSFSSVPPSTSRKRVLSGTSVNSWLRPEGHTIVSF